MIILIIIILFFIIQSKRKRENSIDSMMNQTFIQRGESNKISSKQEINDVKDLKNKMDYLIKKFEKIENMRESDENVKTKNHTNKEIIVKNNFVSSFHLNFFTKVT